MDAASPVVEDSVAALEHASGERVDVWVVALEPRLGDAAFSTLSNLVTNGSASRVGRALRSLRAIAPERALPIVLSKLGSADPRDRSAAVYVLGQYEVATPEIAAALQRAREDPDSKVAHTATAALTKLRQKQREKIGSEAAIRNEPISQGE